MIPEAVHNVLRNAFAEPPHPPPEDETAFFWVEWNEDDDQIPGLCEAVLKTGHLLADWDDEVFVIVWRGARFPVPLTKSPLTSLAASSVVAIVDSVLPLPVSDALLWPSRGDRHVTLLALNQTLHPDYEIRYVRASSGDSPAFVPLSGSDWTALEQHYGRATVDAAFAPLREHPNLFTEERPLPARPHSPSSKEK